MKPTILIVDDDASVTASLGLLLKRHGYIAVPAASQEEALEVVRGRELDLVLQDMNFSRGTTGEEGMELLAAIRRARPGLTARASCWRKTTRSTRSSRWRCCTPWGWRWIRRPTAGRPWNEREPTLMTWS
jgi:CheY-like chemotaxis protein